MEKLQACAIVIGVDGDPGHGVDTCVNDARSMAAFLEGRGFRLLRVEADGRPAQATITENLATKANVERTVRYAADHIKDGGIVVVFFSGHGFSSPETGPADGRAEGWCLHGDDQLWDREWREWLGRFKAGTRVVVVSDSCFSGGMGAPEAGDPDPLPILPDCRGARHVSDARAKAIWEKQREWYQGLPANPPVKATVILLAASQANQNACVGATNGLFTARLLDVAENPALSYRNLYLDVRKRFRSNGSQRPFYWGAGPNHGDFGYQPAFSIDDAPHIDGVMKTGNVGKVPVPL